MKVKKSRSIYNFLDFLGDVGGLFEGLKLIAAALLGVFNAGSLVRFLISQLFFKRPPDSGDAFSQPPYHTNPSSNSFIQEKALK